MYRGLKFLIRNLFIIIDIFALNFVCFISVGVFHKSFRLVVFYPYYKFFLLLNLIWVLLSIVTRLYDIKMIVIFENFTKRTVQTFVLWVVFVLLYLVIIREINFSRSFIIAIIAYFFLFILFNRFLFFFLKKHINRQNVYTNKILILGYNEIAKKLANYFENEGINTQLVGFVEDEQNVRELSNYPILTNIKNSIQIAHELGVNEIFSTIMPERNKRIYNLIDEAELNCMRFKVVPDFSLFLEKPVIIDFIRDMPVLALRGDPLEDVGNKIIKRSFDLAVSFFVTIFILSWMFPLIGLLIKLESKGPIFFIQLRSGRNDQPFYCLKFRSMRMNKDADSISACKNDDRVTKIGSFIRKTSLDEFPQFINVLRGEMSIVGPRPHMVNQSNGFAKIVNKYMVRQFLKPGITGWAQINSYRGEILNTSQIQGRVASDLWYLENWNIWLDIKILFITIYQVILGDKQAY